MLCYFPDIYRRQAISTGVASAKSSTIRIAPNPATEYLTLSWSEETPFTQIKIFNLLGEEVYSRSIRSFESPLRLSVGNFEQGLYFLKMESPTQSATAKWVKL